MKLSSGMMVLRMKAPSAYMNRSLMSTCIVPRAPCGPSVLRNFAATVARGECIFGIDDDAKFSDPRTVAATLLDFGVAEELAPLPFPILSMFPQDAQFDRSIPGRKIRRS
jgi:hypothetical protein